MARPLLNFAETSGQLPAEMHRWVASAMHAAKQPITTGNVDAIIAAVSDVSDAPGFAEIGDALFAAGILSVEPLPTTFTEPVAVGTSVDAFAGRLRQILSDSRRDRSLDLADMSSRRPKLEYKMVLPSHGRETFERANRMARPA
jgi:hypothetical protein